MNARHGQSSPSKDEGSLRRLFESDLGSADADAVATQSRRAALAPHLPDAVRLVVDLGCGTGVSVRALLDGLVDQPTVLGIDWGHGRLREARERGLVPICATLDPAALPLRDAGCDLVVFSEVVEHLVETDVAMAEIHRILRPGGVLYLTTPNLAAWFNRLLLSAGRQPVFSEVSTSKVYGRPGSQVVGHLRLFTLRALIPFVEAHGFRIVGVGGAPYHDTPRRAKGVDRLLAKVPSLAADLVVVARRL